jgi:hypothetical protein
MYKSLDLRAIISAESKNSDFRYEILNLRTGSGSALSKKGYYDTKKNMFKKLFIAVLNEKCVFFGRG